MGPMQVTRLTLVASLFASLVVGCSSGIGLGTDTSSSGGGGSTGTTSTGTSTSTTGGVSCTTDPQSGVILCEGLASCPGVDVDQGAFPNCGFRLHGPSTLDLECLCNGEYLCPMGVPTSCAAAQQLLDQQASALIVCQAVNQGSCLDVVVDAGSSSACDRACESQCQSDPGCISLCGC